ncbi:trichoplein keratin filament-binding protein-like [Stigmatopora nigra]
MARPTLSTYAPYRQRTLGVQMAWKKEQQCRRQEQWALNAKYLREEGVRNHFYNEWTSRHCFNQSMSAYCRQKLEDEKMNNLEERRLRLKAMLDEEQKQLDMELKQLQSKEGIMMKNVQTENLLRGERRKKLAQQLLREHRKRTNPELQQVETKSKQDHFNPFQLQILEKKPQEVQIQNEREMTREDNMELVEHSEENRNFEDRKREQQLHKKMEQLRALEEEATYLKKEEETIQIKLWELDRLEVERKKWEERRKRAEMHRHFLTRQYRAQLRRRAQQVQEELKSDFNILSALLKGEQDVRNEGTRRERIFADAAWMKQVIEEQLQLEREREAEFDLLHREEAQRVWEKREATWEHERKARELLMHEVLTGRRKQLDLKLRKKREAQLESLKKRDKLIQELEKENNHRHQERELEEHHQAEQLAEQELRDQCRLEDLEDEMDVQLSRDSTPMHSIMNRDFQSSMHNKARVAWT